MTTKADRLKTLKSQAERAQGTFEEAEKKLYRPDGSKLYSEDVHKEEVGKLRSERKGTIEPIEHEVFEIRRGAEADRERARHFDPMDALTGEELARANSRRAFSADAAETLPVKDLEGRLDAAIANGDRGALYALYVGAQKRKASNAPTALDGALGRAEAALIGDRREKAAQEAGGLVEDAMDVELHVSSLKEGARNSAEAWTARRTREGAYRAVDEIRRGQAERAERERARLGQAG